MKIQRFEGKDLQEALRLAQLALGPDAVILQTRRVPGTAMMRLVGKLRVEVLAAVDLSPSVMGPPRGSSTTKSSPAPPPASSPVGHGPGSYRSAGMARGREAPAEAEHVHQPAPPVPSESATPATWSNELAALRREMSSLRREFSQALRSTVAPGAATAPPGTASPSDCRFQSEIPNPKSQIEEIAQRIRSDLCTRTIEIREGICTAVALVGPTGVGKTTTLAKLAAVATHVERKRVALITVDTYRIGAVEQLETYARLLGTPLSVAYSEEDVRAARERYLDYDLVLVDTVGRPPGEARQLEEMAALLQGARLDEVHLALDARGSYATLSDVLRGFRPLRPTHLLLSKLDETPQLEDSLTAALEGGLPLSYVTTGQRVPEDLAPADGGQLAEWLLGGR
jgi:flagellar biosynthesis protein FlhF